VAINFALAHFHAVAQLLVVSHFRQHGALMVKFQERIVKRRCGFRSYSRAKDSMELSRAKRLVEAYVKEPIEFDVKEVLLNGDWIYVPWGWIGCFGYLVHRRTERILCLGTGAAPHATIWGICRGSHYDKPDTLAIKAVQDLKELKRALGRELQHNPVFAQFDQRMQSLPCIFRNVELWRVVEGLVEAEERGYCEFEINPTETPAS
jgi:hypothetical protein